MAKKREYQPDSFYHVTNRSRDKLTLFKDFEDFQYFTNLLFKITLKYRLELVAYCLMDTHFHILIKSPHVHISNPIKSLKVNYSYYLKYKYKITSPIIKEKYHTEPITNSNALKNVSRYIHLNPVRAKIVQTPEEYAYSSYRTYKFSSFKQSCISHTTLLNYFQQSSKVYCDFCVKDSYLPATKDLYN